MGRGVHERKERNKEGAEEVEEGRRWRIRV